MFPRLEMLPILGCAVILAGCGLQLRAQAYSSAGAARYMQAQDWTGLERYSQGWTRAEPNNAIAWGYLGMDYGLHLHQPAQAAAAIRRSLGLNPNQPDGIPAPERLRPARDGEALAGKDIFQPIERKIVVFMWCTT